MQKTKEAPAAEPQSISGRGAPSGGPAATVRALSHSFGELRVLDGLDLTVGPHEVLGVVGPSGCGKSTLLELVAGLREQSAGEISVGGETGADGRLARCAYMPQRDLLFPWLSALDNASLALRNRGERRNAARRATAPLFERFGLAGFEDARPAELSGGMRQRVAFLRTLMAGKPVLLLDEPFGGLDAITRGEMQEWLARALEAEPRAVILVSHDVEEALYLSDRVAVLSARPASLVAELAVPGARARPRADAITTPEFARRRQHALAALAEGAR
jgi:ABC-type nitrate/sulfonate/bicarbonate transport system ATPase subunit